MLYIEDLWWVRTSRGMGRVKLVSDKTYNENPTLLVEIIDGPDAGKYKSFDTDDLRTVANHTYGIPDGKFEETQKPMYHKCGVCGGKGIIRDDPNVVGGIICFHCKGEKIIKNVCA